MQEYEQSVRHAEHDAVVGGSASRKAAEIGRSKERCQCGFTGDGNQGSLDIIAKRDALRLAERRHCGLQSEQRLLLLAGARFRGIRFENLQRGGGSSDGHELRATRRSVHDASVLAPARGQSDPSHAARCCGRTGGAAGAG